MKIVMILLVLLGSLICSGCQTGEVIPNDPNLIQADTDLSINDGDADAIGTQDDADIDISNDDDIVDAIDVTDPDPEPEIDIESELEIEDETPVCLTDACCTDDLECLDSDNPCRAQAKCQFEENFHENRCTEPPDMDLCMQVYESPEGSYECATLECSVSENDDGQMIGTCSVEMATTSVCVYHGVCYEIGEIAVDNYCMQCAGAGWLQSETGMIPKKSDALPEDYRVVCGLLEAGLQGFQCTEDNECCNAENPDDCVEYDDVE